MNPKLLKLRYSESARNSEPQRGPRSGVVKELVPVNEEMHEGQAPVTIGGRRTCRGGEGSHCPSIGQGSPSGGRVEVCGRPRRPARAFNQRQRSGGGTRGWCQRGRR